MIRNLPRILIIVALIAILYACTRKGPEPTAGQQAQATGSRVVNLAIWSNYVSPELLAEFEKRTGIHVEVSNYSSNEELLAKLQAGASGYDVAVPSDYMVFAMAKLGLVRELDRSLIPNFRSVDPKLLGKSYDPTNKYSIPYDWGTTGIAYNNERIKRPIQGWKDLFENPELAGKYTLLDDVRETIGAALKALGYSLNSTDPKQLQEAKELLLKARRNVKAFTSEPMVPLTTGETAVAHAFSPDALQARRKTGGKIDFVLPVEGGTLAIDNLVIPAGATHVEDAHRFINFMLEAKSNVSTVMAILVAPASREAFPLLPPNLRSDKSLFPPDKVLAKFEMMQDLGDSLATWDRIWTEVKAER